MFVVEEISKKYSTFLVYYNYGKITSLDEKNEYCFDQSTIWLRKGKCFIQVYNSTKVIRYVFVD